jgi:hypothetical protein
MCFFPQYASATSPVGFKKTAEVQHYADISKCICATITTVSNDAWNLNIPYIFIIHKTWNIPYDTLIMCIS